MASGTDTGETVAEPVAAETVPRRRWPWVALVFVLVMTVAAAAVWLVVGRPTRTPAEVAREELRVARLELINAAGAHYVGRFTGKNGQSAGLDLRVTNTGDASGTIEFEPGTTLKYLRAGGKTFVQGGREALLALGFSEEGATGSAGRQILQTSYLFEVDVVAELLPSTLGRGLDPNADNRIPVDTGPTATIDGASATGVVSGAVTTYVASNHVVRVVDPTFDVRVTRMDTVAVAQLYSNLRTTVSILDDASNLETQVVSDSGWSTPCGPRCSAVATLTSTPKPFVKVTLPGVTLPVDTIFVAYQLELTIDGTPLDRPDCSGIVEMPGAGTTTVSCAFAVGPGARIESRLTTRPILGRAAADDLVRSWDTNAKLSKDKARCPTTSTRGEPKTSC
ncbi:hypothetical protein JK358_35345 [Nocardia sp. 2]|uniref:DUF4352 domain-containing protein n=1 Tax=Nocardia acididurans TaxID=2802282 RepID=A0ABS1MG97_9NOCA|nr:hypothetical protein [Nocardia acididurans]MBL1079693.1 hypothetical protein [Nocardia acididurans]